MSEYEPVSVMMASGTVPPRWSCTTSMTFSESRGVPDSTLAARPADWSLSMFNQVTAPVYTNTVRIGYARVSGRSQDHQMQLTP
jgi:hypothetical protein